MCRDGRKPCSCAEGSLGLYHEPSRLARASSWTVRGEPGRRGRRPPWPCLSPCVGGLRLARPPYPTRGVPLKSTSSGLSTTSPVSTRTIPFWPHTSRLVRGPLFLRHVRYPASLAVCSNRTPAPCQYSWPPSAPDHSPILSPSLAGICCRGSPADLTAETQRAVASG